MARKRPNKWQEEGECPHCGSQDIRTNVDDALTEVTFICGDCYAEESYEIVSIKLEKID